MPEPTLAAIIVAGGSGKRFGSDTPKQYLLIGNDPVIVHTVRRFVLAGGFSRIILVVHPDYHSVVRQWMEDEGVSVEVVESGPERQDSVANGLEAALSSCDRVLIHDAARPLVDPKTIRLCAEVLLTHPAVVAGYYSRDTVKQVSDSGEVLGTIPRAGVFLAQTPQGFNRETGLVVLRQIRQSGLAGTDDVFFAEKAGVPVQCVPASPYNLKITTRADFDLVSTLIAHDIHL